MAMMAIPLKTVMSSPPHAGHGLEAQYLSFFEVQQNKVFGVCSIVNDDKTKEKRKRRKKKLRGNNV
jgi:hypothetical protein